jgi:hypothetical protein
MLDDIRTTRRRLAGAASLGFVALALVVGLMVAGDDDGGPATTAAPTAATDRIARGSEARPEGGQGGSAAAPCDGGDGACRDAHRSKAESAESTQETLTTDDVVAPPGRSEQEQDLPAAEAPNVNPDHYGPGGEPESEPSVPAAEGAIDGATAPNRNPNH